MTDITARNRANKRKGATWEIDLEKFYAQHVPTERLVRRGKDDEGDVIVRVTDLAVVFEAKAEKQFKLTQFSREAREEALRWEARHVHTPNPPAFVVGAFNLKIPRLGIGEGIVGITNEDFRALLLHLQGR